MQKAVKLLHRRNCIVQVRNMVDASSQRDLREASVYQTFMLPNLDSHTGGLEKGPKYNIDYIGTAKGLSVD